jgi:hypothetical protein
MSNWRRRQSLAFLALSATFLLTPLSLASTLGRPTSAQQDEIGLPAKGEVLLEGTVHVGPQADAQGNTTFQLKAVRRIAPDGTIAESDRPVAWQIRSTPAVRLTGADPLHKATPPDLDYGASVSAVGKIVGKSLLLQARAIHVKVGASEAMGTNILAPTGEPKSWRGFLQREKAEGSIAKDESDPGVLKAVVTKTAGTDWHAQIAQQAKLEDGKTYTLRFRLRADSPRLITVDSQTGELPYRNVGLYQVLPVDAQWRPYWITFKAQKPLTGANQAPSFLFGAHTGSLWLSDVALVEGEHAPPLSSRPTAPTGKNLLFAPKETTTWMVKEVAPAQASLSLDEGALKMTITKLDNKAHDWGVQLFQMVDLEEGRKYRLRFVAKADTKRPLRLLSWIDQEDFHFNGLDKTVELGTDWKTFEETFTAEKTVSGHVKAPCFCVGTQTGSVWVTNVVLEAVSPPKN